MKSVSKLLAFATILISSASLSTQSAHAVYYTGVGVSTDNLFMYFDTANNSGYSYPTLTDLSGNGNNATATYAGSATVPTYNYTNGTYLSFPGNGNSNGGYFTIPTFSTGSTDWSGISVSMYVNIGAVYSPVERVFDFGNGNPSDNFWIGTGDYGQMAMEVFNGTSSNGWCRSTNYAAGTNEWAHWTFIFNGSTCKVYKNNILNNTVAYTYKPKANINITRNYIGKSNWGADPYFEGSIADLAIYKKALTDDERTQNYNAQTDITPPTYTGPASYTINENQTSVGTLSTEVGSYFLLQSASLDSSKFSLASSGQLAFSGFTPNYESPTSVNNNNTYTTYFKIMDGNGNVSSGYQLPVYISDVAEFASLTTPTLSASPYKGVPVTITVTPSTAANTAGKVTFLWNGKRIPKCYNKLYSGNGTSTCSWKPTSMGYENLSVTFTPNKTSSGVQEYAAATSKLTALVLRRTTTR